MDGGRRGQLTGTNRARSGRSRRGGTGGHRILEVVVCGRGGFTGNSGVCVRRRSRGSALTVPIGEGFVSGGSVGVEVSD